MKRYAILFACVVLALSVMAPGNAAAEFSCDECHGYAGVVKNLKYKAETVIGGDVVSFSGMKSYNEEISQSKKLGQGVPSPMRFGGNSYLMNLISYNNPNMNMLDWCTMWFDGASIWISDYPDSPVGGALFGGLKKEIGNAQMAGFITTAGYVDGYINYFDIYGMPVYYYYGTGSILVFKGSAEAVVSVKPKGETEKAGARFRFMVAEAYIVEVWDGEIYWDTLRPASAEISVAPGKYYLEYVGGITE